jgi:hypothetical protein
MDTQDRFGAGGPQPAGRAATAVGSAAGAVGSAAGAVKNEVQRLAEGAKQDTRRVAEQAKERASDVATGARDQTAERLNDLASALRGAARELDDRDVAGFGRYAGMAAEQVDRAASYLQGRDLLQLYRDTETFARRHPDLFVGGAFFAGVVLARFLKSTGGEEGGGQPAQWESYRSYGPEPTYVAPPSSPYVPPSPPAPPWPHVSGPGSSGSGTGGL